MSATGSVTLSFHEARALRSRRIESRPLASEYQTPAVAKPVSYLTMIYGTYGGRWRGHVKWNVKLPLTVTGSASTLTHLLAKSVRVWNRTNGPLDFNVTAAGPEAKDRGDPWRHSEPRLWQRVAGRRTCFHCVLCFVCVWAALPWMSTLTSETTVPLMSSQAADDATGNSVLELGRKM